MAAVSGPIPPTVFTPRLLESQIVPTPVERLQAMLSLEQTTQPELDSVMVELYGKSLVDRVEASSLRMKWPPSLGRKHILEMIAAIGHAITLGDLNCFLEQLKEKKITAQILHFLEIDQPERIQKIEDDPKSLQKFMTLLRDPMKFLDPNPLGASVLWEELASCPNLSDKRCLRYTSYEYSIQRLLTQAQIARPEFKFSPAELLAKHVANAKPESITPKMVIPVFRCENGPRIVYYELDSYFHDSGMHAYLFTPIYDPNEPAQLVFRGTNGMASLQRDLDTTGIGKEVFDKNAIRIIRMVESYCQRAAHPQLEISGHSLGAADAQRALALLVDFGVHDTDSAIATVESIKMFAFCSPKLDEATVQTWNGNLRNLAKMIKPPKLELNFALHQSDFLTWSGDFNLHGANVDFLSTNYLLAKSPSGVLSEATHHMHPFFLDGNLDTATDQRTFVLFQDVQYRKSHSRINELEQKRFVPVETVTHPWDLVLNDRDFIAALTDAERAEREELLKLLDVLERSLTEIKPHEKGWAQHSWTVWIASWAVQPVKSALSMAVNLVKTKV